MSNDIQRCWVVDLSRDWRFARKRVWRWQIHAVPSGDADGVDLPHTWNAQDDFQEGVTYYRGPGVYWKSFRLPPAAQQGELWWTLESDGFYGTGDVWFNGRRVARVDGQYLGFTLDVTPFIRSSGENQLCIRLTNRCGPHVLPGIKHPDFLLYGGLAGQVRLVGKPALQLLAHPQIVCENVLDPVPSAVIRFGVANRSAQERHGVVRWQIAGNEVALELHLAPHEVREGLTARIGVAGARLWSPAQPQLYPARGELLEDDVLRDAADLRVGFRQAEFRPDQGFFLNGARLDLRGVNRHENMPGFGQALPAVLHREDARLIQQLGLNFVRLSHYPQSPAFLDACDELGLLVYAELASWKSVRTGRWLKNAVRQFRALIQRDRNHPSIMLWGMGNEAQSRTAYLQLRDVARELDPTRPVTYAENHFYRARREKTLGLPDVWGCNYEFAALAQGRDAARLRCVVISECSNQPLAARGNLQEALRQVENIERDRAQFTGKPFVAGFALWCLTDYGTLRKNRFLRYSGVLDAWRMPKPAAALLQAHYAAAPMLSMAGDWQAGGGDLRSIHIFTNCTEVRIFQNDALRQTLPGQPHLTIQAPFQPGELRAEGWCAQTLAATARLVTCGPATRLVVQGEPTGDPAWLKFLVSALDAEGRTDVTWNGEATLAVEGAARVHTYKPGQIMALRAGLGRGFLSRQTPPGPVLLRASAAGLAPATLRL